MNLVKAKESLIETIEEIDAVAKETFLEAFDKIKTNFIQVFRSLFTEEDECDLKLVDPENPLESAIEIMAKPKGEETSDHQPAFRWRENADRHFPPLFHLPAQACPLLYL